MVRPNALPPIKCSAKAKHTGQRCRRWAIVGTTVCKHHGGKARQVKEKAMQRLTLAELHAEPGRHPWQVVLDATRIGDTLMRDAEQALRTGDPLTPDQVDRLVESTRFAHHLAKTALDTRAHENIANAVQVRTDEIGKLNAQVVQLVVSSALDVLLPLPDIAATQDPAAQMRISRQRNTLHTWLMAVAQAKFLGTELPAAPVLAPLAIDAGPGRPDARDDDSGTEPADVVHDAELVDGTEFRELTPDELEALAGDHQRRPRPAPPAGVADPPGVSPAGWGHSSSPAR